MNYLLQWPTQQKELAEELGVTEGTVYTQISKKRNGWYKVDLEDDSE